MRTKVNDVTNNGNFNDSDLARRIDAAVSSDSGKLAGNVSSESN